MARLRGSVATPTMVSAATVTFVAALLAFTGIGVYSATRKRSTADDYLLASRSVHPWLASLSAVSTQNSGYMFIGLIGYTFSSGLEAMWMMAGWVFGDWIAWRTVHRKLREGSERANSATIPGYLASGMRGGRVVAALAGVITLVFLSIYAAQQLNAGSKALHVLFGWDMNLGVVLGAGIVVAYCFAGGIRASIWTDVAQSLVMITSMLLLCGVAVYEAGGFGEMWAALEAEDPTYTTLIPTRFEFGFGGFVLGWVAAGFGVVGQPHVMVRMMALDSPDSIDRARRIYLTWFALFSAACIGVGIAARATIPMPDDAELALPLLSQNLLPGALVGLVLAGLFAATISTADSQVLSCSAAVTQDLFPRLGGSYKFVKLSTLVVAAFAMVIGLRGGSVFALVLMAWSALAAGLGPLLIVRSLGWRVSAPVAVATMVGGVGTVGAWMYLLELNDAVYAALPGMAAGFLVYLIATKLCRDDRDGRETLETE